ncbi:MAG: hypothetical protein Tp178MES00d2C33159091_30 [Prokaryotic dsDNA virus sp.]|uniref:hypothetical protein n=1 Tax=Thalassospira sp. TaxID=1912094 RepID=UPI000C5BAB39|nr:hypothetical protein [Thalassospira sp.]QDP60979.1 MAG: hypothetical protein Tp178MES00d2C33159091_30 [Prokaryotic dsDNA virus sp.]MAZ33834.1 hypothetical protein [Thalassospira sp.]MAZ33890.1 hypothetical protein [Thalassospira sp.]MAZ34617.1 hypothetical protein [Thalassospira sp.]QDP64516.1 MAG: hypothetical protein Tp178SUR1139111_36 [Prokaryotic dsDNA virus sp.]
MPSAVEAAVVETVEMDEDLINSDLVENPGTDVPEAGAIETVGTPASNVPAQAAFNPFDDSEEEMVTQTAIAEQKFGTELFEDKYKSRVPGERRPIAASLLAIALADPKLDNEITMMNEANLVAARELLDGEQEYNARLRVAANRSLDALTYVDTLRKDLEVEARTSSVNENTLDFIDQVYNDVVEKNNEDAAQLAVELEAIDKIRTYMTNDDNHEALLVADQFFAREGEEGPRGGAEKRIQDHMAKVLVASQRLEELEAEYEDSGWVRGFFNGIIRAIPTFDLFSASGITNDAGITNETPSLMKFIMAGNNLQDQRESLWDLSPEEFARTLAKDGEFMQAIRDNADWLMDDPTRRMELGQMLIAPQEDNSLRTVNNVFGIIDATLLGATAVGRVGKSLSSMGARRAATIQTTKAVTTAIENGPDAAKAATGIGSEELTTELSTKFFDPTSTGVSLGTDVASRLQAARELRDIMPDLISVNQFDNPDDILAAFQVTEKQLLEDTYGKHIKDIKFVETNLNSGKSRDFGKSPYVNEDGANVYTVEVTLGKKEGGGYARKDFADGLLDKFARQGETFKDPESGQWFARMEVTVPVDGFITSELKTPSAWFPWIRSSARIADRTAVAKGVVAGNSANRFLKQSEQILKDHVKGLPRQDRRVLTQTIMKGQNEAKWYNPEEFAELYQRAHPDNQLPTPAMQDAYSAYRLMSDVTWTVRNDAVYIRKSNQGFESHNIRLGGRDVDIDGVINPNPKNWPTGHKNNVWDASNERWLDPNGVELKDLVDEGYVMLKLDRPFEMPDGRYALHTMVKKSDLKSRPLRRMQLNYSQGGSRAYDASHYIKQAMQDVDGNLISPRTFVAGKNLNEMKAWATDMNEALRLYKEGERNPLAFETVFKNRDGYPSGEEFLEMVETRKISKDFDFEVVENGKSPKAYFGKDPEALRFIDPEELEIDSYYKTTGQMYYGTKGDHLQDTTGSFAATIDPWETLNSTINEAARVYGFRGYKENVAARFKNTYAPYLDLDFVGETDTLYGLAKAKVRRDVPEDIAAKIGQEQSAIVRLMNFETEFEKRARIRWGMASEAVLGDAADDSLRAAARRGMLNLQERNPIQFMRTLAFDANLGFFNIGQLFIQTSTMASASAMSPKYGLRGFRTAEALKVYAMSGYDDTVLDTLAKKKYMAGGFDSPAEFKEYARYLRDTGLYEVSGHNLAMIKEFGANRIFGASSVYDGVSEKGRMFFYLAEQLNRSVSSRIAWGELKERGVKVGSSKFKEEFALLTDDYSFNMMSQTSAGFQHGLASVPTQFWAYSFRMMDALLGKRFTPQQKARLFAMNLIMGGSAAIPGGLMIKELYEKQKGSPVEMDEVDGWIARGFYDGIAYLTTGADVKIGERIASGDLIVNVVRDLFGTGEYGEKSVAEMFLGATGGKLGSTFPSLYNALEYSAYEILGAEAGPLAKDSWLKLADEVASFRGAHRAYIAHRYNEYYSRSGALVDSDLPESSAFFLAMTFTPGTEDKLSFYFNGADDTEMIKEAATKLSNWRQQAFTRPDTREENMQKAAALMSLYPPHVQVKIRQRAREVEDVDMYNALKKNWEQDVRNSGFIDEMVPLIEDETLKESE